MHTNRTGHVTSEAALLRCPKCSSAFDVRGSSLVCASGHCYDISAKGYVNFVPAKRDTFYRAELFDSRARIHALGAYAPVADAVRDALREAAGDHARVLDAGCGDGYYARQLSGMRVFALDLSKQAVALAARGGADICPMVGDLTHIPLCDGAVDAVINVLSPAHYPEFRRVLRTGGCVIKVVPEEDYLSELRQAAGKQLRHADYSNEQTVALFRAQFPDAKELSVRAVFPIPGGDVRRDVLYMTPLLADADKTDAAFQSIDRVTISVKLLIGRRD